ncbi:formylglycine-generating enzyme family protein [Polyangium sorediatum]|uniref:Formylglycine-generating enzyme family protein n=1 Tax=Polyangium sorediatum TaxID=889274 RepID=A0ABT6P3U3_9BACT|nr:formylglycine-generating enzyme family protein [Polyangium sorediatum]MDI1435281.1 formylglycine-generating enzyme family protein [Polyangium sorediatum]
MKRALVAAALFAIGCQGKRLAPEPTDAGEEADPPWVTADREPEPRPGMAWIPPGSLIAGTPPEKLPRVPDEEMAGEQVVMSGFYIDLFPYPNEPGAIPTTNVSQAEAAELCAGQQKRLCTELEWERACKGPQNTAYPYGDTYKPATCMTGSMRNLVPNGVNAGCKSAFGVHDLHGGVWQWTSSQWRRDGSKTNLGTTRGGNAPQGELVGRCANGRGVRSDLRRADVGFRCCAGEPNSFEVVLNVSRGAALTFHPADTKAELARALAPLVPEEIREVVKKRKADHPFEVERIWTWHPLGNEELVLGGGCAKAAGHARCGVVVARMRFDAPVSMAFVPTELWQPTVGETETPRELFVYGGDDNGAFRRRVSYEWGKIGISNKERKKKRKGKKEPTW